MPIWPYHSYRTLAYHINNFFSDNANSTFSTQLFGFDVEQLERILTQWRADTLWYRLHHIDNEKVQMTDGWKRNWLHVAAQNGDIEYVRKILETNHALSHAKSDGGRTALNYAVESDQVNVVRELLAKGAEPKCWQTSTTS